jgi:hypothetical protein
VCALHCECGTLHARGRTVRKHSGHPTHGRGPTMALYSAAGHGLNGPLDQLQTLDPSAHRVIYTVRKSTLFMRIISTHEFPPPPPPPPPPPTSPPLPSPTPPTSTQPFVTPSGGEHPPTHHERACGVCGRVVFKAPLQWKWWW